MIISDDFENSVLRLTGANTLEELTEEKIMFDAYFDYRLREIDEGIMDSPTSDEIKQWAYAGSYTARQQELIESMFETKLQRFAS